MALILASAVALVAVPVAAWLATRGGFVDRPGPLKVQTEPVAYGGGVAVLAAVVVPLAHVRPTLLIPLALACALGLADDTRGLAVGVRVASEVVIASVAVWVTAPHTVTYLALGVVLVVVLLNAANLLDGLDGLLSSVASAGALGFCVVLGGAAADLALALIGALVVFVIWNRPPAHIYLGDAGSYLVGTALAMLFIAAVQLGLSHVAAAPLFVAVAAGDTVVAIVRRLRAGKPVLQGDRGHVYDQLVDRGWPVSRVVLACATAQLALTAIGIGVASVEGSIAIALTVATAVVVGVTALWRFTAPRTWVTDA